MLIKGISNLKFCAYVGLESNEYDSGEIFGLEEHKLAEQYKFEKGGSKYRAPPLFRQPTKTNKSHILQLIKAHSEKRRLIKLLEKKNILNSNKNDSFVPIEVVVKVEEALKKVLKEEVRSLYKEVKTIIKSNNSKPLNTAEDSNKDVRQKPDKNRWPVKPMNNDGQKLSAVINEPVTWEEDAAFEMDEQAADNSFNLTADGIADDRGTIDHNQANDPVSQEESVSSSEEAMLHCKGVILSQPLVSDNQCDNINPRYNTIKYQVEEDGYYYFIFSSANEKVTN